MVNSNPIRNLLNFLQFDKSNVIISIKSIAGIYLFKQISFSMQIVTS